MKVLSDETVRNMAREFKKLGFEKKVGLGVVHMMDSEEHAQEMLDYLRTEQPTDDQVVYCKMEEILGLKT